MNIYLVKFTYDYYCQGYDETRETVLVRNAPSFAAACNRIVASGKFYHARDFENMTIDLETID